jgi:4'-phosphopantetheinyl transferase
MICPSFELPPSDLTLRADEIHIWIGELDQPVSEFNRFLQTISLDERMRAGWFHFQEKANRYIIRHGMLRMILGRYMGVKASALRFHHGKHGKPAMSEIIGKENIRFNLSHSEEVAIFAFARNQEIGVDIEHIRDIPEMEQIVKRFFSARDQIFYSALPRDKRREAFFHYWTSKEAFIKALGEGLSRSLEKIDVTLVPGEGNDLHISAGEPCKESGWSIHTIRPAQEYAGALAIQSENLTLRSFKWMPKVAN